MSTTPKRSSVRDSHAETKVSRGTTLEEGTIKEKPRAALYTALAASWTGSLCMGTALGYSSPAANSLQNAYRSGETTILYDNDPWYGIA